MLVIDKVYQKECFENVSNNHWVPPSNGADAFGVGVGVVEPLIPTHLSRRITRGDENAAGKEHTCVSF
jgi:hypothetical protein